MKNHFRHPAALALAALMIWSVASWFIARANFLFKAEDLIRHGSQFAQVHAQDLADSIHRNIGFVSGIPNLLSSNPSIGGAVARFGKGGIPSSLPYEERKKRWTSDRKLFELDKYLEDARTDLNVDLIYVANAAGDCIAASNWNLSGSPIGTNFAAREYFRMNREGRRGMQYAVGETTHVPGLFFSFPIFIDGRFMGAVVAKINIDNLSFLMGQTDAYVADSNGIIILSNDKSKEMLALPDTSVDLLPVETRMDIYAKSDFRRLKISSWGDSDFGSLRRIENEPAPHVAASAELPEYGLKVFAQSELPAFLELREFHLSLFEMLFVAGGLLILLVIGFYLHLQTISRAKSEVEHQAHYDALTQLPNRRLFNERLEQEIRKSARSGKPLALLLIDLDGFKEVNDTFGHHMGDALLVDAAHRIHDAVRDTDTIARLGGDEFIVILPGFGATTIIERIAQDILRRLAEPFFLRHESASISASIGVVQYPTDATDVKLLLKHADQAMYAAKRGGRNRFNYFVPALEEAAQQRRILIKELGRALSLQQLHVYYQPIVELQTGSIHKAEALLRWQHPERGFVSPADFIPLAESSGLIMEIGDWVFRQVAKQSEHWRRQYDPRFQISVNKSPAQFKESSDRREDGWIAYLRRHGLSGASICVEITEGLLLNAEDGVAEQLLEYSQAGIQVAMDDFGTGYSSLAYLKKFDIDYLKIDRTFVRDLATDYNDLALCEAIIAMAHSLGLKVIAEGVETEQQRHILSRFHCDYAQGYLFARPIPAHEFESLLADINSPAILGQG